MTEPRYPFVAVDTVPDLADEISAALFDAGALGVEERDSQTLARGSRPDGVTLVGSFETREAADEAIAELSAAYPDATVRLEEVVGDAWRDAWKEHFSPFSITERVVIVPPWIPKPDVAEGTMLLELEPGRAFGTGLHATTSLVAELLDTSSSELVGREILDVGTGSGILSLLGLLYGASRALAIDVDPDVVDVVRENAARNGLQDRIEARAGTVDQVTGTYPWVLANIEARVLRPIAADLARVVAKGGTLILSGILASEHDELVTLYTNLPQGLVHTTTRKRVEPSGEGWVAIAFSMPS